MQPFQNKTELDMCAGTWEMFAKSKWKKQVTE